MTHIATRKQFSLNMVSGWVMMAADFGVALLLTPFIVTQLGVASYGVWSLMNSVIGYMGLVDIGIRGSVGRYINHYLALKDDRAVSEVVGTSAAVLTLLGALAGIASLVLASQFATVFPKTPPELLDDIRFALPLLALGLWMSFMSSILSNLLMAREAIYLTNGYGLVVLVLRTAGVCWALGAGHGLRGLVLVTIGTSLLNIGLTMWAITKLYGSRIFQLFLFSFARLREMWRFGIASFVSRTASTMANDSAPIIGMWTLGPEAVGIYSVALTLTQNARRVIEQANTAIFPSVMKAGAIKDYPGLRDLYLRFMDISFAVGTLIFVGLMVFTGSFLTLWVGPQYAPGAVVAGIIAFGYLIQSVSSTAPLTLASLDRIGVTVRIGVGEALACIVLTLVLPGLLGLGLVGLALGTTLPRLFSNCVLYPRLATAVMGAELRIPMLRAALRNLLTAVLVALVFWAIHRVFPVHNWAGFATSVAIVTTLYLVFIASRYESLPVIGGVTDRIRALWLKKKGL